MDKVYIEDALQHLEGTIFGRHCNGEKIVPVQKDGEDMQTALELVNDSLMFVPGFSRLNMSTIVTTKYGHISKVVIQLTFGINWNRADVLKVEVPRIKFTEVTDWFCNLLQNILDCNDILENINRRVKEWQMEHGGYISISYKASFGQHMEATVSDWDYNNLKFSVNWNSILNLGNQSDIQQVIDSTNNYYAGTLGQIINGFNDCELHRKMKSWLSGTPITILKDTHNTLDDLVNLVHNRINRKKRIALRSSASFEGLGQFVALFDWIVDFTKRRIDIKIVEDKVYDAESDKFIRDGDVYAMVKKRIQLPQEILPIVFGDTSIEAVLEQ